MYEKKMGKSSPEKKEKRESEKAMLRRLNIQWELEHKAEAIQDFIEGWADGDALYFTTSAVRERLGMSRCNLMRVLDKSPELSELYSEVFNAKIACAEADFADVASGGDAMTKDRAFQAGFALRSFSKRYIRRVENTGEGGGPQVHKVIFETADSLNAIECKKS